MSEKITHRRWSVWCTDFEAERDGGESGGSGRCKAAAARSAKLGLSDASRTSPLLLTTLTTLGPLSPRNSSPSSTNTAAALAPGEQGINRGAARASPPQALNFLGAFDLHPHQLALAIRASCEQESRIVRRTNGAEGHAGAA